MSAIAAARDRQAVPREGSLLANANFRWLWLAHLISMFGDGLYNVALPWLVYRHTGSGAATALTLAAGGLPYVLVSPIAGVYVDRWDRRRTLVGADLLRAAVLLVLPLFLLRGFNLPVVLAMAVLLPSVGRFFVPAQRAARPGLVPADSLIAANALMEGAGNAAFIAGPALGGLLMLAIGAAPLLIVDGATFVASALCISLITFPQAAARKHAQSRLKADLVEGLRMTWEIAQLRMLGILAAFVVGAFAIVPALVPLWVGKDRAGGAGLVGTLMAAFFIGALSASLLVARIGRRWPRERLIVWGIFGMAVATAGFAVTGDALLGSVALAAVGAGLTVYNVGILSSLQRFSPTGAMGRVLAINDMWAWSLRSLVVLAAGIAADRFGVRPTLLVGGAALLVCSGLTVNAGWLCRQERGQEASEAV